MEHQGFALGADGALAFTHRHHPALQGIEQAAQVIGDQVHHAQLLGLGGIIAGGLGDHVLGQLGVQVSALGHGADQGGEVAHHLFGHGALYILAAALHRLAAPMWVAGAMAATEALSTIKAPALVALAPPGDVNRHRGLGFHDGLHHMSAWNQPPRPGCQAGSRSNRNRPGWPFDGVFKKFGQNPG
jgi:hypothetical protein